MIRVVVKCVLDRLWQSPKIFLAKRGEVFIDDLFRYLSAALLRSARSTFSWIFFSFGYWFKYDDSAVVWFLYGYCHVIRNCYWTEQVRPNDNSLGTRERWKNGSQQLWPIWPSQSILPSISYSVLSNKLSILTFIYFLGPEINSNGRKCKMH